MAKRKQQIIPLLLSILALLAFTKCANQISPPGGEVDKTPPYIIESFPQNGTVDFKELEIELSFSEYVNKRNMSEAFFISPLIEGLPGFSWTNKTVYIEFSDSLKNNTTYSLIIGTEITDVNNNNKMKEPFVLTFSTGSKIDSGSIAGRVYTEKGEGTLIFAYKTDTGKVDIYNNKPDYLSQIDEKGFYEIKGLGDAEYLLFAVKDDFKDLVYNIGDDLIGLPNKIVSINREKRQIKGIDFLMQKEDTLMPNIQSVTMTDKNHLVIEFNEPIDSSDLTVDNFSIIDSTENRTTQIKYWFKTKKNKSEYILSFIDSLNTDNEYYLIAENIKDRFNNLLINESSNFISTDKPDTNGIKLNNVETLYERSQIDFLSPSFNLTFSDAFELNNFNESIKMLSPDSIRLPLKIEKIDDASLNIIPEIELKPSSAYTIFVDMNYFIDAAGNKTDTILTRKLTTISDMEFTGASGVVNTNLNNVKVVIRELKKNGKSFQTKLTTSNSFNFERIIPGEYLLWAYEDKDSNSFYSKGTVDPLILSEFFKFYPDTLNLRARWPVGDIKIDLLNN